MANANHTDVLSSYPLPENSNLVITGNGSNSSNGISVANTALSSTFQNNDAYVSNHVDSDARTGGNDANRNTGGDISLITGHARTDTSVTTDVNLNEALSNPYQESLTLSHLIGDPMMASIDNNGSGSTNGISLANVQSLMLVQDNNANIRNRIDSDASTGHNDANDNTNGSVRVDTGNATSDTSVDNQANFNFANIDDGWLGSLDTSESGNGSNSSNSFSLALTDLFNIFQGGEEGTGNQLALSNRLDSDPSTGGNDANRNTGSDSDPTYVISGHAVSNNLLETSANQNYFGSEGFTLPGGFLLNLHFNLGV